MEDILYCNDEFILKANEYINDWEYIKAKRVLEDLLEKEPNHAYAHNTLGWLYYRYMDEHYKAAKHYRMAIRFNPQFPYPYRNYVILLNYLGKYSEAIKIIDEALTIQKVEQGSFYQEKGKALELLQKFDQAIETYKEAILNSTDDELIQDCKNALERINNKKSLLQDEGYTYSYSF